MPLFLSRLYIRPAPTQIKIYIFVYVVLGILYWFTLSIDGNLSIVKFFFQLCSFFCCCCLVFWWVSGLDSVNILNVYNFVCFLLSSIVGCPLSLYCHQADVPIILLTNFASVSFNILFTNKVTRILKKRALKLCSGLKG